MEKIVDCNYMFVIMAIIFISFFGKMTNLEFFTFIFWKNTNFCSFSFLRWSDYCYRRVGCNLKNNFCISFNIITLDGLIKIYLSQLIQFRNIFNVTFNQRITF